MDTFEIIDNPYDAEMFAAEWEEWCANMREDAELEEIALEVNAIAHVW